MKAIVDFKNGVSSLVVVNLVHSTGGVIYYNLTLNALKTYLDFKAGETKVFTEDEIKNFVYVMS
jgi:hypothetical protein